MRDEKESDPRHGAPHAGGICPQHLRGHNAAGSVAGSRRWVPRLAGGARLVRSRPTSVKLELTTGACPSCPSTPSGKPSPSARTEIAIAFRAPVSLFRAVGCVPLQQVLRLRIPPERGSPCRWDQSRPDARSNPCGWIQYLTAFGARRPTRTRACSRLQHGASTLFSRETKWSWRGSRGRHRPHVAGPAAASRSLPPQ